MAYERSSKRFCDYRAITNHKHFNTLAEEYGEIQPSRKPLFLGTYTNYNRLQENVSRLLNRGEINSSYQIPTHGESGWLANFYSVSKGLNCLGPLTRGDIVFSLDVDSFKSLAHSKQLINTVHLNAKIKTLVHVLDSQHPPIISLKSIITQQKRIFDALSKGRLHDETISPKTYPTISHILDECIQNDPFSNEVTWPLLHILCENPSELFNILKFEGISNVDEGVFGKRVLVDIRVKHSHAICDLAGILPNHGRVLQPGSILFGLFYQKKIDCFYQNHTGSPTIISMPAIELFQSSTSNIDEIVNNFQKFQSASIKKLNQTDAFNTPHMVLLKLVSFRGQELDNGDQTHFVTFDTADSYSQDNIRFIRPTTQ